MKEQEPKPTHTPEPWRSAWDDPPPEARDLDLGPIIYSTAEVVEEKDVVFATWHDGPLGACTKPNAARIVACVNALAGVVDPAAELARLRRLEARAKALLPTIREVSHGAHWTGGKEQVAAAFDLRYVLEPETVESENG